MAPKVVAIIQARMGSKRLPGKVLKKIKDETLLSCLIKRVLRSRLIDEVVIATGEGENNKPIVEEAKSLDVCVYKGSEEDVLARFVLVAKKCNASIVVRITADNPLLSPKIIDGVVSCFGEVECDIAEASPIVNGSEVEVMSYGALLRCEEMAKDEKHREHVTLYMKDRPDDFKRVQWKPPVELQRNDIVVGVDTQDDLERLRNILNMHENSPVDITLYDMVQWVDAQKVKKV